MFSKKYANNYDITFIERIFNKPQYQQKLSQEDYDNFKRIYNSIDFSIPKNQTKFIVDNISRQLKFKYSKTTLIKLYRKLIKSNEIIRTPIYEQYMVKKATRGHSGVQVVTIFTSGTQFGEMEEDTIKKGGCPKNCKFCPYEKDADGIPTQPRSYLSKEPGNMRASYNLHHPVGQMFDRIFSLEEMGHISPFGDGTGTKLEIIISGGTFNFYPKEYIIWFVTCMYFAANIYYDYCENGKFTRDILTLEEEQHINETAMMRVIGLTVETRPDYLNPEDFDKKNFSEGKVGTFDVVRFFRQLGVTRVQIGIQHTSDLVLAFVDRDCTDEKNKEGIKFLKQNGFKADAHLMLDMPAPIIQTTNGITERFDMIEEDKKMLKKFLTNPEYEVDQLKIYPTSVTSFTVISDWYHDGYYVPYAEIDGGRILREVIIGAKLMIKPWIRINRVIRDFSVEDIEGGVSCPDMRDQIEIEMKQKGIRCKCIRCRELKLQKINYDDVKLFIRKYEGSDGDEYFISYETNDELTLIGFIRLRLNRSNTMTMPELHNTAFIRELHVLGNHTELKSDGTSAQHRGYGRKLIEKAEEIAQQNKFNKIAIISGVGVRDYYRKFGYKLESTYMMKSLQSQPHLQSQQNIQKNIILDYMLYAVLSIYVLFFAISVVVMIK